MLSEFHALSIIIFLDTIIESPSTEADIWEHVDLTLKVGCFIFPSISLTIRNIWNVLFAGYKNKSNRQSCVGKNLFFLRLRSLALCPHFQDHHFLSTIIRVNGCFPVLGCCFHSGWYQGRPHFPSCCSLFCHHRLCLGNVLLCLIMASCSVRITVSVVVLLIKARCFFPWFSTQWYSLVTGISFLQRFDYGPRSRQMRMRPLSTPRHFSSLMHSKGGAERLFNCIASFNSSSSFLNGSGIFCNRALWQNGMGRQWLLFRVRHIISCMSFC